MIRFHVFACARLCAGLALVVCSGASAEPGLEPAGASVPSLYAESPAAAAEPTGDEVPRDRAVVDVRGLVCSFCAHGVERALSSLPAIDTAAYGGDGVLVEIEAHRVTLAMRPGAVFPLEEVGKRIRKAGYDPQRFRFWSEGKLQVVDADAE